MIAHAALLTDEQELFLESVDGLAATRIAPVAAAIDATRRIPAQVRGVLVENELHAVDGALEDGGAGGDLATAILMLERLAAVSASVAVVAASSHVYAGACRRGELPSAKRLAGAASGRWAALADGSVRALAAPHGLRLEGSASAEVVDGVDRLLVLAETDDAGPVAVEIAIEDATLQPERRRTGLGGVRLHDVEFDGVPVDLDAIVGGHRSVAAARLYSQLAGAAIAVGIAEAALGAAVAYLTERRQFGRPLADFPALRAMVAEMDASVHGAAALVHVAAAAREALAPSSSGAIARAARAAGRAAYDVSVDAIQLHGGYGYTTEFPVERLFRDAISARARLGARRFALLADGLPAHTDEWRQA